jgi:hypothetical protein
MKSKLRSLEHARVAELLVAGHRLMEAAEDVATFARAYRAAEDALVAVRVACVVTKKTNAEGVFNDENDVDAGPVSDAVHRAWLADGEPTKTSCQRMGPKRVRLPGPRAVR